MSGSRLSRALVVPLLALVLALPACGGQGTDTRCGVDGCTVTFDRTGGAQVSVLGVSARLLGVENQVARVEVAGQTVSVPVGGEAQAGGFTVRVEQVTDAQVVVSISA